MLAGATAALYAIENSDIVKEHFDEIYTKLVESFNDEQFIEKLKDAHPNRRVVSIMLQILIPETPEFYMDDLTIFHDYFESIQDNEIETKWGLSHRSDDSHMYKLFIIVGFK